MNFGKKRPLTKQSRSPEMWADDRQDTESPFGTEGNGAKDTVKRKSRNQSEKKRRDKFNLLVDELSTMVSNNRKMDKTTVIKTAISVIQANKTTADELKSQEIKEDWKPSFMSNNEFVHLMLEAIDACILVLAGNGRILYVSESVTALLGHLPKQLSGQSLLDLVHSSDRARVHNTLSCAQAPIQPPADDFQQHEQTTEGRPVRVNFHIRCGGKPGSETTLYELVTLQGILTYTQPDSPGVPDEADGTCFCCTVRLRTSQLVRELTSMEDEKREFTSRHSLEWKILFLDHRGPPIIGYLPIEVLGTSGYDYVHPDDLTKLATNHEQMMQLGEGKSCYYRFMTKGQQWIWLQSRYYITYHQLNSKPECVVCTNTVVSYADVQASVLREGGYPLTTAQSPSGEPSSTTWPQEPTGAQTPSSKAVTALATSSTSLPPSPNIGSGVGGRDENSSGANSNSGGCGVSSADRGPGTSRGNDDSLLSVHPLETLRELIMARRAGANATRRETKDAQREGILKSVVARSLQPTPDPIQPSQAQQQQQHESQKKQGSSSQNPLPRVPGFGSQQSNHGASQLGGNNQPQKPPQSVIPALSQSAMIGLGPPPIEQAPTHVKQKNPVQFDMDVSLRMRPPSDELHLRAQQRVQQDSSQMTSSLKLHIPQQGGPVPQQSPMSGHSPEAGYIQPPGPQPSPVRQLTPSPRSRQHGGVSQHPQSPLVPHVASSQASPSSHHHIQQPVLSPLQHSYPRQPSPLPHGPAPSPQHHAHVRQPSPSPHQAPHTPTPQPSPSSLHQTPCSTPLPVSSPQQPPIYSNNQPKFESTAPSPGASHLTPQGSANAQPLMGAFAPFSGSLTNALQSFNNTASTALPFAPTPQPPFVPLTAYSMAMGLSLAEGQEQTFTSVAASTQSSAMNMQTNVNNIQQLLHIQLVEKHRELQSIKRQQLELQKFSEQLLFASQLSLPSATMPSQFINSPAVTAPTTTTVSAPPAPVANQPQIAADNSSCLSYLMPSFDMDMVGLLTDSNFQLWGVGGGNQQMQNLAGQGGNADSQSFGFSGGHEGSGLRSQSSNYLFSSLDVMELGGEGEGGAQGIPLSLLLHDPIMTGAASNNRNSGVSGGADSLLGGGDSYADGGGGWGQGLGGISFDASSPGDNNSVLFDAHSQIDNT